MRFALLVLVLAACSAKPPADGWRGAKLGTVYETRTITRMQRPFEHETTTTTKQTLVGRNDHDATIKLEVADGPTESTQTISVPLNQEAAFSPHDGSTVTRSDETCTVPAGTFHCTRTTLELGGHSSVTWTTKRVPVPLRTIVSNENMTITSELISLR